MSGGGFEKRIISTWQCVCGKSQGVPSQLGLVSFQTSPISHAMCDSVSCGWQQHLWSLLHQQPHSALIQLHVIDHGVHLNETEGEISEQSQHSIPTAEPLALPARFVRFHYICIPTALMNRPARMISYSFKDVKSLNKPRITVMSGCIFIIALIVFFFSPLQHQKSEKGKENIFLAAEALGNLELFICLECRRMQS